MTIQDDELLTAVGLANEKLKTLGLSNFLSVLYIAGSARLVDTRGKVMAEFEAPPRVACGLCVLYLENAIVELLRRSDDAEESQS
jgi:hypothetical protein